MRTRVETVVAVAVAGSGEQTGSPAGGSEPAVAAVVGVAVVVVVVSSRLAAGL